MSCPGSSLRTQSFARHARARIVHLSDRSAWAEIVEAGHTRLCSLPLPAG